MIVAREKERSYGFFEDSQQQRRSDRNKTIINADKLKLTTFVIAVFGVGIFVISYFVQVTTLGYKVEQFNRDLAALRVENQALEEQYQQMLALENVESIAIDELDMVKPVVSEYLLLTVAPVEFEPAANSGVQDLDGNQEELVAEEEDNVVISIYKRFIKFVFKE